jgi:hypothetical protein
MAEDQFDMNALSRFSVYNMRGGGDSPINDFTNALGTLKQGLNDYAQTQVMMNANQQIQSMQDQDLSEQDRNTQLNALGKDVTRRLAMSGMPINRISDYVGSFQPPKPPVIQSDIEMAAYGTPQQQANALKFKQQVDDLNLKYSAKVAAAKTAADAKAAAANDPNNPKTVAAEQKQVDNIGNIINPANASSRKGIGQVSQQEITLQNALNGLMSGDPSKATLLQANESAAVLGRALTMGVPTQSTMDHFVPTTAKTLWSKVETAGSGSFASIDSPDLMNQYKDIMTRLEGQSAARLAQFQKDTIRQNPGLMKRNPDLVDSALAQYVKNPDGTSDHAHLEDGRVVFDSDKIINNLNDLSSTLYSKGDPSNPKHAAAAQAIVDSPYFQRAVLARPDIIKKLDNFWQKQTKGSPNASQ